MAARGIHRAAETRGSRWRILVSREDQSVGFDFLDHHREPKSAFRRGDLERRSLAGADDRIERVRRLSQAAAFGLGGRAPEPLIDTRRTSVGPTADRPQKVES